MTEKYSKELLMEIYESVGGQAFVAACSYVATMAPQSLTIDGVVYKHSPERYSPRSETFAYTSEQTQETTYLTAGLISEFENKPKRTK